jgi:Tfp pilus assembly protein PilX
MRDEKGASLLIVIVTVFIVFTLGLSLASMTLSSRVQINKTEKVNVATDLAEMGVTYFDQKITNIVAEANATGTNFCSQLNSKLTAEKSKTNPNTVETNKSFKIYGLTFSGITIQNNIATCQDPITIDFNSYGLDETNGKSEKTLKVTMYINKVSQSGTGTGTGTTIRPIEGWSLDRSYTVPQKGYPISIPDSVKIINSFHLSGQEVLTFTKNAYFSFYFKDTGKAKIFIEGDAFFTVLPEIRGNGYVQVKKNAVFPSTTTNSFFQNNNICVQGSTYILQNNVLVKKDFPRNSTCPPINTGTGPTWSLDVNPFKIVY